ncbi:UNKNOWN [Stylonychia lemnae]|uniref:Uncharacterized protein n=1 Tax=Stylonychia lemnae TaxID=5949 RepID=A0A078BF24_STYLE|nr:UNKNOWN [Stylonychia lemnae]|eukprot:CDW91752.1 UNKNOWN [Stylonychia lemnae]
MTYARDDYDTRALDQFAMTLKPDEDEGQITDVLSIQKQAQLQEAQAARMSQAERKETIKVILQKQRGPRDPKNASGARKVDFKYDEMLELKKKLNKVLKNKGAYNNFDYFQQEQTKLEEKQKENQKKDQKISKYQLKKNKGILVEDISQDSDKPIKNPINEDDDEAMYEFEFQLRMLKRDRRDSERIVNNISRHSSRPLSQNLLDQDIKNNSQQTERRGSRRISTFGNKKIRGNNKDLDFLDSKEDLQEGNQNIKLIEITQEDLDENSATQQIKIKLNENKYSKTAAQFFNQRKSDNNLSRQGRLSLPGTSGAQ